MSRYRRERLIEEVKRYPVLYDTKHENHRDIDVRDRCWQEIAQKLGISSEVLKRDWKILRDSMRQALKRTSASKAGEPPKKWRYQNLMAFVLPHLTIRRKREVRIKPQDGEEQEDPEELTKEGEWSSCGRAAGEREHEHEHEALELFFASVCQSAKRLPARRQAALKRHVLDALLRAEDDWEREQDHDQEHKERLTKFNDVT